MEKLSWIFETKVRSEHETHLQAIAPDLYDGLYEQVKAKVLAYISGLVDQQDKPVVMMLIKAGMVKRLVAERTNQGSVSF